MVRRRNGALLPLEVAIIDRAVSAAREGPGGEFHGFAMAKWIRDTSGAQRLTGHGTLYKALARLEAAGLLESRWEDADTATAEGRPRRRLYRVTALGERALAQALATAPPPKQLRPGVAPL